jgi:hypothetical protein
METYCCQYDEECTAPATHRLMVNGKPANSGCMCQQHAEATLALATFNADLLGSLGVWTMYPLDQEALDDDSTS